MSELITNATFDPDNVLLSDAPTGEIPVEHASTIITDTMAQSAVMQLAKYEEMNKLEKTIPYLAEGPGAYWVNEGEVIKTSKAQWLDVTLTAKKLGVIIPVSNEFLKYSVSNFFEVIKPKIAEAFYQKFDQAALFGTESPYAKGISVLERATTAENLVTEGDNFYTDLNDVIALVEDGDNDPNALATTRRLNHKLRGALDQNGLPIFNGPKDGVAAQVLGLPIAYAKKTSFDVSKATILTGDWNKAIYGIPQGIEYSISKDATLTSVVGEDGKPINLFERDLVALKVTMYVAFQTIKADAFAALVPNAEEAGGEETGE